MNIKHQTSNIKRLFGLIGYPLAHSFSQKYFTEKFKRENISDCEFRNLPIENINEFPELLKQNPSLAGLSVTIPHKQGILKFLHEIDEAAKKVGAVNCIKISNHKLKGYNTDIVGFEKSLQPLLKLHPKKALVLGTGGAAKAVKYILDMLKISFRSVSRSKNHFSYSDINRSIIQECSLIINTTPLGMFPNSNNCPDIPFEFLTRKHLLYDLIYNPEETLFLKKGKEKGSQIKNGLEMLHLQAEEAWRIWNN
ncbi:MAG: shikimate dehydrogenase [Bacteroidetes bacterium]|nr:shikimate dehydrogenase [Bacteroidota bacterium]